MFHLVVAVSYIQPRHYLFSTCSAVEGRDQMMCNTIYGAIQRNIIVMPMAMKKWPHSLLGKLIITICQCDFQDN